MIHIGVYVDSEVINVRSWGPVKTDMKPYMAIGQALEKNSQRSYEETTVKGEWKKKIATFIQNKTLHITTKHLHITGGENQKIDGTIFPAILLVTL